MNAREGLDMETFVRVPRGTNGDRVTGRKEKLLSSENCRNGPFLDVLKKGSNMRMSF